MDGLTLSDSQAYRLAAERLMSGQDLYPPPQSQDEAFRYAPWFAAAWVPITVLPRVVGDLAWFGLLIIASILSTLPLLMSRHRAGVLLGLLGAAMLLWTSARGNVHPLVMLALVHGVERRSGPLWIALAASIKAVPILFVLLFVARREWGKVLLTLVLGAVLVAPMPLLGWELVSTDPGQSLSLYNLASPTIWAVTAALALMLATALGIRKSRYVSVAAAGAAILVLPRLLLYDVTYLLVSPHRPARAAADQASGLAQRTEMLPTC
ncbi:MAG TPA: glycosyltransferase family 87 protein [candidate division Zixibacteria bacterium]|nr:glycosyltransferase family 87 protein [candidate division Zixibacteria bacterium]